MSVGPGCCLVIQNPNSSPHQLVVGMVAKSDGEIDPSRSFAHNLRAGRLRIRPTAVLGHTDVTLPIIVATFRAHVSVEHRIPRPDRYREGNLGVAEPNPPWYSRGGAAPPSVAGFRWVDRPLGLGPAESVLEIRPAAGVEIVNSGLPWE